MGIQLYINTYATQNGDIGLPWPRETLNKWYHGIAHLKKQSYVFGKHSIPSGKLT